MVPVPALPRGRGALLKGTGALTWTLQGAGVGGWRQEESTPLPRNAQNRERDAAGEGWRRMVGKALVGNPLRQDPALRALPGTREQRSWVYGAAES